ncbi:hypothetical protein [Rhodosalinus sp.]|uniref:hypothetical protein n=1 Tax=Rhodosalinus sp. TaxID=2047741 RepID=UPI0039792495
MPADAHPARAGRGSWLRACAHPLTPIASPALAGWRPPPDHSEALPALCDRVQATPAPATAQPLDEGAWELCTDAPDKAAQAVLSPTAPGGLEL